MPAFRKLLAVELRIVLRDRTTVPLALGIPLAILVLFGILPFSSEPAEELGGARAIDAVLPSIALGVSFAMLGLSSLPTYLATYRERGVLRRLQATPLGGAKLLMAQLVLGTSLALAACVLVLAVGRLAFGVTLPADPIGFVVVLVAGVSALFGLGLVAAAVAPSAKAATGIGMAMLFPMMALGGIWVPRFLMPDVLQRISDFIPLGALLESMQDAWTGAGLDPLRVIVMAAVAIGAVLVSVRTFRWE
jgi:ABC-2 type transport system permease protein